MLRQILTGILSLAILIMAYVFQKFSYWDFFAEFLNMDSTALSRQGIFNFNKIIRFLMNDLAVVGIIYSLFRERKYVVFALYVQAFGLLVLLPTYLFIKSYYPAYNGALINFLHRITLNPILMLLLIPALFYQRSVSR